MPSAREETINQAKALFDKVGFKAFDAKKVFPFSVEDIEHFRLFNLLSPVPGSGRYKFKKSPFELKEQMF